MLKFLKRSSNFPLYHSQQNIWEFEIVSHLIESTNKLIYAMNLYESLFIGIITFDNKQEGQENGWERMFMRSLLLIHYLWMFSNSSSSTSKMIIN